MLFERFDVEVVGLESNAFQALKSFASVIKALARF